MVLEGLSISFGQFLGGRREWGEGVWTWPFPGGPLIWKQKRNCHGFLDPYGPFEGDQGAYGSESRGTKQAAVAVRKPLRGQLQRLTQELYIGNG